MLTYSTFSKALFVLDNGNFDRGIGLLEQSVREYEEAQDFGLMIRSLVTLGEVLLESRMYPEAIIALEKALLINNNRSLNAVDYEIKHAKELLLSMNR